MPKRSRRWSAKPVLAGSSPAATSIFKNLVVDKSHLDIMDPSRLADQLAQYPVFLQGLFDCKPFCVVHVFALAAANYTFELNLRRPHDETVGIARCVLVDINENTASNSDRFVMGPSKIQLESVIRRSQSENMNNTERFTIKKTLEEDGILRELIGQPRRVHYVEV